MQTNNYQLLPHLRPPTYDALRLTVPARELISMHNRVIPHPDQDHRWSVTLIRPPAELVVVSILDTDHTALRCFDEVRYPQEINASCWVRGAWLSCPRCGYATLWCEAGFVPGWRICLAGHALQLSPDGRSLRPKPKLDEATLAATRARSM